MNCPKSQALPLNTAHQREECAEACDRPEGRDVAVHVLVFSLGVERVLALDPAALHILVPALGVVCPHQRGFALARAVELDVLHLVLAQGRRKEAQRGAGSQD